MPIKYIKFILFGDKIVYVQNLQYFRTPPAFDIPPNIRSRPAGYTQMSTKICVYEVFVVLLWL